MLYFICLVDISDGFRMADESKLCATGFLYIQNMSNIGIRIIAVNMEKNTVTIKPVQSFHT